MRTPPAEAEYLRAVVVRLRDLLGDRLVAVYPTGSVALDGYRPGRSDLDLIAVADGLSPADVAGVAAGLAHEALPCPATGLEFVLYDKATVAELSTGAGFALNLNTGRELPARAETEPEDGSQFWYPIDRDIVHQQGRVLTGPAFTELSPRLPHATLLSVVRDSVATFRAAVTEHGDNAVLNGCRALHFHVERSWVAKPAAARWALRHAPGFERLIAAAAGSHGRDRTAGTVVAVDDAKAFLGHVLDRIA